jgi:DNA polymerase alpha-associated DNA helicase A
MEGFDAIVCTCIGAADKIIMAAMGRSETWKPEFPLSFPFVVVDEACQSLEAATLVPVVNANPKSLVLLGDPMQLPPTVLSNDEVLEKR